MNIVGLIALLFGQFITGRGLLQLFKLSFKPLFMVCFSLLSGVAIYSFLPFFAELAHIEITTGSMAIFMAVTSALFALPLALNYKALKMPRLDIKMPAIYELPFYVVLGLLMFLSAWRAFYYPPNARDMTSGPEVMAELALREKHMINSLFRIDLQSTNNYLKPPFITSLQILYKMFVQPFGQTWLTIIFFNFVFVTYNLLKEKLHPILVGFAMLFFFGMPEVFGYTYLMLFDYSNMVYFFFGFYFLQQYLEKGERNLLGFSIFLFAIATYIRTETLILVGMTVPYMFVIDFRKKVAIPKIAINTALLLICPFIVYFLCMNVYVKNYIPIKYDVSKDVNQNLGDVSYFFNRLTDMSTKLIFSENGNFYYGQYVNLFLVVLLADIIFFRKFLKEGVAALYAIALVYVGLAFIGYLLPLADLMHTTKRGLFKLFPFILLYYRNSPGLLKLTELINGWEYNIKNNDNKPLPVVKPVSVPAQNTAAKTTVQQSGAKKKK